MDNENKKLEVMIEKVDLMIEELKKQSAEDKLNRDMRFKEIYRRIRRSKCI